LLADTRFDHAEPQNAVELTTLDRRLALFSDAPSIIEYVRAVYRRACLGLPPHGAAHPRNGDTQTHDTGVIRSSSGADWLVFNGEPVCYLDEKPATHFRLAFYGSSKLIRLSFRRNADWHSLYAAAMRIAGKAIIISARSGIGKTTLALELMSRGAGFYSDEFVFIRKSDRAVSGLPRALMIRARTLSLFPDCRLRAVCETSKPRTSHGDAVWDNIDAGDVFGEQIFAQPAALGAAIVLERGVGSKTVVEPISAALAAADFNQRLNSGVEGFGRLADTALMLQGIPCFRIAASTPQSAADAIEALL
jgi:hypothetical protein